MTVKELEHGHACVVKYVQYVYLNVKMYKVLYSVIQYAYHNNVNNIYICTYVCMYACIALYKRTKVHTVKFLVI